MVWRPINLVFASWCKEGETHNDCKLYNCIQYTRTDCGEILLQEDNSEVSIFTFDVTKNRDKVQLAKHAYKKMRTLRHPDLLRYLDGVEVLDIAIVEYDRAYSINIGNVLERTSHHDCYGCCRTTIRSIEAESRPESHSMGSIQDCGKILIVEKDILILISLMNNLYRMPSSSSIMIVGWSMETYEFLPSSQIKLENGSWVDSSCWILWRKKVLWCW